MSDFKTAILLTLKNEGGFQKDPKDRANWTSGIVGVGKLVGTKYGITTLDMPGVDIENITTDQAVTYYAAHYWKPYYSQLESQPLASKLFDMGVLFGVGTAVKILQFVLDITVDGNFGPQTLTVANAVLMSPAPTVLEDFKKRLKVHAQQIASANPNETRFLAGWEHRIDS